MPDTFHDWLERLEQRHLADLRVSEVTRALRALSVDYVHRRERVSRDALAGRGKRAAFALFYGPLHFFVVREIARQLSLDGANVREVVDLGCGSGAAGAALGSVFGSQPFILGIDRQGWVLEEASFAYRAFALRHRVVRADARALRPADPSHTLIVAAYTINELGDDARADLLGSLQALLDRGAGLLIVEPIARAVTPWWSEWRAALASSGVRGDDWRFTDALPEPLRRWDRAAGLDHRERKARSLFRPPGLPRTQRQTTAG